MISLAGYAHVGYLLNTAARRARQDLNDRMQDLGLTFPQWMVLKDLSNHRGSDCCHLTMAAIARRLSTQRPNVLGILERLEKLGLVQRVVNPNNRRAHIVSLTDSGREMMKQLQELSQLTNARALQGFDHQEAKALEKYLARISTNLGKSADNSWEGR